MKLPHTLPAALLFALAAACTGGTDPAAPADGPPRDLTQGRELYQTRTCQQCHGPAGEGGPLGPALQDLADRWSRDDLAAYLRDPAGAKVRPTSGVRYPAPMPPSVLTDAEMEALMDFVLAWK